MVTSLLFIALWAAEFAAAFAFAHYVYLKDYRSAAGWFAGFCACVGTLLVLAS